MGRGKKVSKPIGFRPSEKALQKIEAYMTEHKVNRNQAINQLIAEAKTQPQLEHSRTGELPPLFHCQDLEDWIPKEQLHCSTCQFKKNVCSAWR